jgi:hypothetical protein
MGSVFDSVKTTYSTMFDGMVSPRFSGPLTDSVADTAQDAYNAAQGTAAQKYEAAKTAVADVLSPTSPLAAPTVAHVFDAVHSQQPPPVTPETSTAHSVADAARKTANLALGAVTGTLKLSGPSLLGTWARVFFGIVSALVAGGCAYLIYRLADDSHSHPSDVVYVALAVAIFMSMLTLLLCVTGYSNVSIEGTRGKSS